MSSFYEGQDPDVDTGGAQEAVALGKAWAIKLDGPVDGTDYSSEYNANQSANSAAAAAASAGAANTSAQAAQAAADQLNSLVLADLVNVSNAVPQDGAQLVWNDSAQLWEPSLIVPAQASQALLDKLTALEQKLIAAGVIT